MGGAPRLRSGHSASCWKSGGRGGGVGGQIKGFVPIIAHLLY